MKSQLLTFILVLIFNAITAQIVPCNTTVLDEPFNSSNIPGANSAVLLNNGMAGSNHVPSYILSGNYFGWFNPMNGLSNIDIYNRSFSTTPGCQLSASMWVQESFGGTSITLSLKDISGTVLTSTTLNLTQSYQLITLTATAVSTTTEYVIHYNSTGAIGYDVVTEDLLITQTCISNPTINAVNPLCENDNSYQLSADVSGGVWLGNGITNSNSGLFNPSFAGVGTHEIIYIASIPCTGYDTIDIDVVSYTTPTILNTGQFCFDSNSIFLLADMGNGIWSGNGILDPQTGEFNSSIAGSGFHTIYYELTGFCEGQDSSIIEVFDTLSIIKTVEDTICKGDTATFIANGFGGSGQYAYSWSANGSIFSNSNEIYVSPDTTCVYHITVSDSCGDSISQSVVLHVLESLDLNFSYVNNYGCSPLVVTFDPDFSGIDTCYWDFGDTNYNSTHGSVSHTYYDPGIYHVTLSAIDQNNCMIQFVDSNAIIVFDDPIANFITNPPVTTIEETTVDFLNMSLNSISHIWYFGDGDSSFAANPTHQFSDLPESYLNCLVALNNFGCSDTICKDYDILLAKSVYIPNSFTPNGDGVNDGFGPSIYGPQLEAYQFYIYNRWGNLVFESNNVNDKWNGSYKLGDPISNYDVFVWKLKYRMYGEVKMTQLIGNVTVLGAK